MASGRVPVRILEFIDFSQQHATLWDLNHAAIGVSSSQIALYKTVVGSTQANYNAQTAAETAAKSATVVQQKTTRDCRTMTADLIRTIDAFAQQQANPAAVYALAGIPAPAAPSPAAPPGTPTDFKAELNPDGSITLSWKAENISGLGGTVWFVSRKLNSETAYRQVGAVGLRSFTDATIPSSSGGASYKIRGQRGASMGGESLAFTVQFGVEGGGLTIAAQFSEKLAA